MKKDKEGKNNTRNKTMLFHKDIPYELVGQFTTSNETGRISYFDQSWRKESGVYS